MYTYENLSDLAHAREDRRNHLVSRIRGWLRKDRRPRMMIALLLIPTAAWIVGANFLLRRAGLELTPLRWAFAILTAWPYFVLLLRWRASVEWQCLHLERVGLFYERHDEGVEAARSAPGPENQWLRPESIRQGISSGLQQGGQQGGAAGLPVTLLVGALTLGGWTLWKLICSGPSLLADVIVNGHAVPSTPSLATRISSENWFCSALGETYLHFLSLAFAAFVTGLAIPFFEYLAVYRHALHPEL